MREIKFRAFSKELGTIHEVDLINWENGFVHLKQFAIYNEENEQALGGAMMDKLVVMQFTGLHDKNGKEIYEGDIIGTSDTYKPIFVVKFGEYSDCVEEYGYDGCGWYLDMGKEQISLARMSHINSSGFEVPGCEVIGNIHQNPELLK